MTYKLKLFLLRTKKKIFSIAVATVKIFDAVISKKNDTWYGNNMLDMTLGFKNLVGLVLSILKYYYCKNVIHFNKTFTKNIKNSQ